MKQRTVTYTTTLTSKGQLTLPVRVRDQLGFKPGTTFEIETKGEKVVLNPKKRYSIFDLAGSLKKYDDGRPWEEVIEEAKRLAAEDIVKRKR